jgi:putative transposase
MDNHYHLLIETNTLTLSKGMKFLNGALHALNLVRAQIVPNAKEWQQWSGYRATAGYDECDAGLTTEWVRRIRRNKKTSEINGADRHD